MLEMKNDFFVTDDDCMQCCKPLGERKFLLIQVVWLDRCGNDTRAERAKDATDNYVVVADTIDIASMELEDISCAITGFYDSLEHMENIYSSQLGNPDLDQLIAECAFESNPYCSYDLQSDVVSWADAVAIIQKFIDSNGENFEDELSVSYDIERGKYENFYYSTRQTR